MEKLQIVPMLRLRAFGLLESLRYRIWNLFYIRHLNLFSPSLTVFALLYTCSAQAFLLSFIFLSCLEGRKLLCCSKSLLPPHPTHHPSPQHQRWLQGEAYFPVSRVSQLTKNLGFHVNIRSRWIRKSWGGEGGGGHWRREERRPWSGTGISSSSTRQAWESAELLLVQEAERNPVTVHEAGYHSTEVFSK